MDKKNKVQKVPEYKIKLVENLADNIKSNNTLLIASTKALPSAHFHSIKKNLRGKTEIKVAKKTAVIRAIDMVKKKGIESLKPFITSDVAMFFSNLNPFDLSALLSVNQSPASARGGDIAPNDITIEPGPTDLPPGPAISELSGVGLKVSVEGGKLAIKNQHTVVKAGEVIKDNVASVLTKLHVKPLKVGFDPIAAYDNIEDKVFVGIKIDKNKFYDELKSSIGQAFGFSVKIAYPTSENVVFIFAKAQNEEKALLTIYEKYQQNNQQGQGG